MRHRDSGPTRAAVSDAPLPFTRDLALLLPHGTTNLLHTIGIQGAKEG